MTAFWVNYSGENLEQGDYLPQCWIPVLSSTIDDPNTKVHADLDGRDLIIISQSCDLANEKNSSAALCPIYPLSQWENINPHFKKKGVWESVRKGRREGLHLLANPEDPEDNAQALVVDFRQIYSLPIEYLKCRAKELGTRWRLQSPYREHFSQSFARFFMRVGLPIDIPPFI